MPVNSGRASAQSFRWPQPGWPTRARLTAFDGERSFCASPSPTHLKMQDQLPTTKERTRLRHTNEHCHNPETHSSPATDKKGHTREIGPGDKEGYQPTKVAWRTEQRLPPTRPNSAPGATGSRETDARLDESHRPFSGVWSAGNRAALDLQRKGGRGHGLPQQLPAVVHAQPWDRQRDLLSARRSSQYAGFSVSHQRRRNILPRGEARPGSPHRVSGARLPFLPPHQFGTPRPLSHH